MPFFVKTNHKYVQAILGILQGWYLFDTKKDILKKTITFINARNRWTFYIKIYPSTNLVTIITHNFLETPQKSDFLIPINNVTLPQRTILDNEYSKYTICSKQDIIDPVYGISAFRRAVFINMFIQYGYICKMVEGNVQFLFTSYSNLCGVNVFFIFRQYESRMTIWKKTCSIYRFFLFLY